MEDKLVARCAAHALTDSSKITGPKCSAGVEIIPRTISVAPINCTAYITTTDRIPSRQALSILGANSTDTEDRWDP